MDAVAEFGYPFAERIICFMLASRSTTTPSGAVGPADGRAAAGATWPPSER